MTPRVSTNPDADRRFGVGSAFPMRGGFSLIEVVVAVGIFAFVIVGVIGLLGPTSKSVADVMDTSVATRLVDNVTAELTRLRDTRADRLDGVAALVNPELQLVATSDGTRLMEAGATASDLPSGISLINDRDQYFLILVKKHEDDGDPLKYRSGSGFLALTISVQWPYKLPQGEGPGSQTTALENRSIALYNIALTP